MAGLTGSTIAASYEQLLIVADGGLTTSLQAIQDGDGGMTSCLKIARNKLEVIPNSADDANLFEISQQNGTSVFNVASNSPAATLIGTLTVGADGSGHDVVFYSGTAGDNFTWDASEEVLQITGTDGQTSLDVLDGDLRVVDKIYLYDRGGEYISSNGEILSIVGGAEIDLTSVIIDINATTTCTIDNTNTTNGVKIGVNTDGGKVFIGHTTSETTVNDNLTITGTVTANSTVALNDDVTIPHGKKIIFDSADTYIYANTDNPEDLVIGADADIILEPDGNVGIGTAAPANPFHVHNTTSAAIYMQISNSTTGATTGDGLTIGLDASEAAVIANKSNTNMNFYTNDAFAMTIENSGQVGIGITDPDSGLEIKTPTGVPCLHAYRQDSGASDYLLYAHSDNGSTELLQWRVTAAGETISRGAGTHASDERLKKNIATVQDGLSKVNSLRGTTFEWKYGGREGVMHGLIAQEVEAVIPELVRDDLDAPQQLKDEGIEETKILHYDGLIPVLIEAVKELSAKVTALENA
jgi:hypothetical protein